VKRLPALLVSAAIGVIALSGCSTRAAGADLAGGGNDPGNRSPMLTGTSALSAPGQVTVTTLTDDQWTAAVRSHSCMASDQLTYCQTLETNSQGNVDWTVYLSVPQDTVTASMQVSSDVVDTARISGAQGPHVKITWKSPSIPGRDSLDTMVEVTLADGRQYRADAEPSYMGSGTYSEDTLLFAPA
jgi:hypothetical protein